MSTTPVPPVPSAPPAAAPSRVALLDTIFQDVSPSPLEALATPAAEPPPAEPPPVEPPAEPVEGTPPAEPIEEEPPADDSDLEQAAANPREPVTVTHSRWHNSVYPGYKAFKAISEQLQFTPAPEDVTSWYQTSVDSEAMAADLSKATPEHAAHFLDYWGQRSPQGVMTLLSTIPDYVARMSVQYGQPALLSQMADRVMQHITQVATQTGNVNLYSQVAVPILQRYENALYTQASDAIKSANPQTQEWGRSMLNAAQVMEFQRTGQFRQDPAAAPPPREDPLAAERARLEAERRQFTQRQQEQFQSQQATFRDTIDQVIDADVTSTVESALAPVRAQQDPEVYEMYRNQFLTELRQQVPTLGDRYRQYAVAYERAVSAPSEEAKAALKQLYASMAKTVAQTLRPKYLKLAAKTAVQQNAQTHAQLARASTQVSPSTAPISAPPAPTPPAGSTPDERRMSILNSVLG